MPTNKDTIRMHLEQYLRDILPNTYKPDWFDVLAFCDGYYGEITLDMVLVVREFQRDGRVR